MDLILNKPTEKTAYRLMLETSDYKKLTIIAQNKTISFNKLVNLILKKALEEKLTIK